MAAVAKAGRGSASLWWTWPRETSSELTGSETASIEPSWSADGRRIAFVSQPDRGPDMGPSGGFPPLLRDRRIWVMDRNGSDKRQLTNDPAYRDERPLWSPDGSQSPVRAGGRRGAGVAVARALRRWRAASGRRGDGIARAGYCGPERLSRLLRQCQLGLRLRLVARAIIFLPIGCSSVPPYRPPPVGSSLHRFFTGSEGRSHGPHPLPV